MRVGSTVFENINERLSDSKLFLNIVWALGEDGWDLESWVDNHDHVLILEIFIFLSGFGEEVEEGDICIIVPH